MHAVNTIQHEAQYRQHNSTWSTSTRSTQATPYLCMGQHGQHRQRHTYVWVNAVNTGNAILMYGSTRSTQATPYLCMGQRGQHRQRHTYVWVHAVNTGNAIPRVHNKGREESVEPAIRVYNNSSESNVTSCLAHVTMPNAKNSKF